MSDEATSVERTLTTVHVALRDAISRGRPAAVATVIAGEPLGTKLFVSGEETVGTLGAGLDRRVLANARALLDEDRSETREYETDGAGGATVFIQTYPAPFTLVICGAVHAAQALANLAVPLGYRVVVTDARATLATRERFPVVQDLVVAWPDEALPALGLTSRAAIAVLTHDPKFDEPALSAALATDAAYIGAIGSRRTHEDRRQRLREAGIAGDQIARIRGPIGLNIGAQSPEEMAVAILAEIIAVRHGRPGGMLTGATGSIRGAVARPEPG
ncbi:MAG: XdhC family protein [Chloroflexia bacterium]|nr:XdhC family protein [Chloroflexia bacterium]MDQ3514102.1 XdhC/CoxI family protein [Chloroflexota bacterium]